ncbi:MAG: hypothetical protein ACPG51_18745 [Thiolinea sp.]
MHSNNTCGASSAHTQNTLSPEQEEEFLFLFSKLDRPTRQILLSIMSASVNGDVELMRTYQQQLPESERHFFNDFIERTEKRQEVAA